MTIKFLLIPALILGFATDAFCIPKNPVKERKLYVGSDSTEAILTFKGRLESTKRKLTTSDARDLIESQIQHLYGPMSVGEFRGHKHAMAVPRGNHKISNIKIKKVKQRFEVTYNYSGTIVLQNGPVDKYDVILPINPNTIFKAGLIGEKNPCTDEHYQDEGDFWYFWNPENSGCKLEENEHYLVVTGNVKRTPNTELSYPEYNRLAEDGVVSISLLMGMDDPESKRDPNISHDTNAINFRDIKRTLLDMGYESHKWGSQEILSISDDWSKKEIQVITKQQVYVEDFTKEVKGNEKVKIVLRIFFGPSGIDEESSVFHRFFKDALENQSILMYDGHSGLGAHLDLPSIEQEIGYLKPNKNRYQIYFFNSCTSYSYYNTMYFNRKRTSSDPQGTKNLDIFTNGLATYFAVMHDSNLALIKAVELYFESGTRMSYQSLAKEIDSNNLFGINGDEDNP